MCQHSSVIYRYFTRECKRNAALLMIYSYCFDSVLYLAFLCAFVTFFSCNVYELHWTTRLVDNNNFVDEKKSVLRPVDYTKKKLERRFLCGYQAPQFSPQLTSSKTDPQFAVIRRQSVPSGSIACVRFCREISCLFIFRWFLFSFNFLYEFSYEALALDIFCEMRSNFRGFCGNFLTKCDTKLFSSKWWWNHLA